MELDPPDGIVPMLESLNFLAEGTGVGPGCDLQLLRKIQRIGHEGMVPGHQEGVRKAPKETLSTVMNGSRLPVHDSRGPYRPPSEGLSDGLVAQTNAQERNGGAQRPDELHADSGLRGSAGSRRNNDSLRRQAPDLFHRGFVIPEDMGIGPKLPQELHKVPGERIVIVQYENHADRIPKDGAPHKPPLSSAPPAAKIGGAFTVRGVGEANVHYLSRLPFTFSSQ